MPIPMPTSIRSRAELLSSPRSALPWGSVLLLPLALACGGDDSLKPEPLVNPEDMIWAVQLNTNMIRLSATSPYDTFTIVATPVNYRNEPLTGLPPATWRSNNSSRVAVNENGKLFALETTPAVDIAAVFSTGNTSATAMVRVQVVADPAPVPLGSYSIHPLPPDSAKIPSKGQLEIGIGNAPPPLEWVFDNLASRFSARAFDITGTSITGLPAPIFVSHDTTILRITDGSGLNQASRPGTVKVHSALTVFGVTKSDTVEYQVGWPVYAVVEVGPGSSGNIFSASEVKIGPGGAVIWSAKDSYPPVSTFILPAATTPTEINFDNPANVVSYNPATFISTATLFGAQSICAATDCNASGNMMVPPNGFAIRRFPIPGTYVFRNQLNGVSGRVVVMNE